MLVLEASGSSLKSMLMVLGYEGCTHSPTTKRPFLFLSGLYLGTVTKSTVTLPPPTDQDPGVQVKNCAGKQSRALNTCT